MVKKNDISSLIVAVGNPWSFSQNTDGEGRQATCAGLPGSDGGYAHYLDVSMSGQFLLDQNQYLWVRVKTLYLHHPAILANNYPMLVRTCPKSFGWTIGGGATRDDAQECWPRFTVTVSGQTGTRNDFTYSYDRGFSWITAEQAKAGITVSTNDGWIRFCHLSQADQRPDGVHVYFGARAHYSKEEDLIYPTPAELILSYKEVPFDYYPGAIYNSKYESCDDPGHSAMIKEAGTYRDIKNYYSETFSDNKGFIHTNKQYAKIARG